MQNFRLIEQAAVKLLALKHFIGARAVQKTIVSVSAGKRMDNGEKRSVFL